MLVHDLFESAQSSESFAQLLAQARERMRVREILTKELVAKGRPVKMKNSSGLWALVSPDMSAEETRKGQWRVSYFDHDKQATGHTEYPTPADAFSGALQAGYRPI